MYSLGVCGGRTSTSTSDSAPTSTGWRAARGISRAALIREIIGRALGDAGDDLADDLAALDESFGVLAEHDLDLRRAPDDRWAHLERVAGD